MISSNCTLHHLWLVTVTCKERKSTPMITSACATALAGLNSTKQSSSGSVDLPGARFRGGGGGGGGNEYAGTYPAKMSTMVHIFADGARIRARICAPVHVYAGGNEYAVTPAGPRLQIEQLRTIAVCVTGELVDFSLFVLFYCYFTRAAPTDLSSRKKEQVLVFFSFLYNEKKKRQPRFQRCDFGCGIRRSGSRSNHWTSMSVKILVRMFVIMQLTHRPKEREI